MGKVIDNIKTHRVLALSGGGVKGIAELMVLIEIEERTGKSISELFPIISGTSVGGLIAGLLTIPKEQGSKEAKYSAKEALEIFKSSASDIFPSSFLGIAGFLKQAFFHKYSQKPLKNLLEEHLGDSRMDSPTSRLVVPVTDLNTNDVEIFDSFNSYSPHVRIKDVLLATTAAPTYFKPIMDKAAVQGHNYASGIPYAYADGGLEANRPANEVLKLLKNGHTREEQKKILDNTMVCSFNFDEPNNFIFPARGLDIFIKATELVGSSIKSQEASSTAEVKIDLPGENEFFEIKLPITKETKELDDASPENIQRLEEIGHKYVQENSELIQKLCDNLVDNLNKEQAADEGFEEGEDIENNEDAANKPAPNEDAANKPVPNEDTANKPAPQILDSDDEGFEGDDNEEEYSKEELLLGMRKFLNEFSEKNPELKNDIDSFLDKAKDHTLKEIEMYIINFKQASLKLQNEQNKDCLISCSMEALKEEIDLEGIDDEVTNHEILA